MADLDDAESLHRQMQRFLYAVSHDLQEPFRKVRTFGQRLAARLEGHLDESARADLERMLSAAERGQGMIEGLLILSRLDTQGGSAREIDLSDTLASVCESLQEAITSSGATVSIELLPAIRADADQMRLLFSCLIDNALKFRQHDVAPVVRVFSETTSRPGFCRIVVEDNGIGLDPSYADRVFTVFQRLHPRDVYPGLGLGLAYCQRIVERHRGSIEVEKPGGEGTRLVVTLPIAD